MILQLFKLNIRDKKYNEAYKVLKLLIKNDMKNNLYKSKEEYLKHYSDLLISLGCFNDLKKQWLKEKLNSKFRFTHNTDSIKEV